MDLLKAEIAKKRKLLQDQNVVTDEKRYFKRSELLAKQQEEYFKQHGLQNEEDSPEKKPEFVILEQAPESATHEKQSLPRPEVIKRFRDRNEPITLFGESEYEAFCRLRRLEILEPDVSEGYRNDLKMAMDHVDQEYLDELMESHSSEGKETADVKIKDDDGSTYEDIQKEAVGLGQGNTDSDQNVICKFVKFLMITWAKELNGRSEETKRSMKGKLERAKYTQTNSYLNPLYKRLEKQTLEDDIRDSITEIVRAILCKDYVLANDAYLQMAIGNAPWPIGVTMPGIHARTGREKIFSKHVAHVLNDETQRKYIQALKRLMTLCQRHFPTDPSRSVDFGLLCNTKDV